MNVKIKATPITAPGSQPKTCHTNVHNKDFCIRRPIYVSCEGDNTKENCIKPKEYPPIYTSCAERYPTIY